MNLSLERLLFDAVNNDGPKLGSYILDKAGNILESVDGGLKVSIVNSGIPIDVTLTYADDSVTAHQGGTWEVSLASGTTVAATQSGSWEVSLASGTTVAATQSGSWEVSLASGTTVAATQSGSWEVSLASGTTVAATQSGSWEVSLASGTTVAATQSGSWEVSLASGSEIKVNNLEPNVALKATAVAMTDAAAAIPATSLTGRRRLQIQNYAGENVFLGDSAVTAASGILLAKGATETLEIGTLALYGICASGKTATLRVLEIA